MHGFSKVLLSEYALELDRRAQDYARRIEQSAAFMDKLLLDLLAYNQIAHSEVKLSPVTVDGPWKMAVAQNEQCIREKQARVEAVGPLPQVKAHEATLGQVLTNLLANALKFMPPDVKPHVRLWAEERSERVRFWLEDNGIGIAPKYHQRVFRIFEQLNGKNYEGTGMGLSIVRKGVERMGGKVGLESAVGRGSKFWIELPKAE